MDSGAINLSEISSKEVSPSLRWYTNKAQTSAATDYLLGCFRHNTQIIQEQTDPATTTDMMTAANTPRLTASLASIFSSSKVVVSRCGICGVVRSSKNSSATSDGIALPSSADSVDNGYKHMHSMFKTYHPAVCP